MSDDVTVRPVRTYLEGHRLVHPGDRPYPVTRTRALELRGNGLAEWDEVDPTPPTAAAPAAPTAEPERDVSRPRPRRA